MREIEPPFELNYKGTLSKVTEAAIKNRRVFYIAFPDSRRPLTITVGLNNEDVKFWTSIPEGRQEEAEEIGKLIAAYIRSKNK